MINKTIESLWTAAEVAAHIKMSKAWVYNEAREGRLPSLRLGSAIRFDPVSVREFLQNQYQEGRS